MKSPAVFLDRDGTLNTDTGYVRSPGDVRLLAGAGEAVRMLNEAGFKVVLVTNQPGVARGLMSIEDVNAVNARLCELLAKAGAHIDGIYSCPHLPDGTVAEFTRQCNCRKPKPGMLLQAAEEMSLELAESFMVGDSPRDMQAGQAVGARTILIDRGAPKNAQLDMVRTALEAAHRIIEISGRTPRTAAVEEIEERIPQKEEARPAREAAPVMVKSAAEAVKAPVPVIVKSAAQPLQEEADIDETDNEAGEDEGALAEPGKEPWEDAPAEEERDAEPGETEEDRTLWSHVESIPVIRRGGEAVNEEATREETTAEEPKEAEPEAVDAEEAARIAEVPVIRRGSAPIEETETPKPEEAPTENRRAEPAARPTAPPRPATIEKPKPVEKADAPVNCAQCGSMISDVDLESGRARIVAGRMLCRECHIYHLARTTHAQEVTNADILMELKNISRTLTFEKFSMFNILGGLAQAGAMAALLYTVLSADKNTGLQLTIALQLMALTFFVLGRQ